MMSQTDIMMSKRHPDVMHRSRLVNPGVRLQESVFRAES